MASACNVSMEEPRTLVLVGRTGNGKSSTGNSILGREAFPAKRSFGSVTKESKMEQCECEGGRVVNVIDTPGMFDTRVPGVDDGREIVKCMNLAERGIHAFLFVVSLRSRFTDEEAESLYMLQLLFGPKIFNYMIIVFTGGDEVEIPLQNYLEDCPVKLKGTINFCNSRMVVFNNHKSASANVKETQITELLEHVDRIVAKNGGGPYSNDLFHEAKERTLQLYDVKDKEKQDKEQYEKELKRVTNESEKELKRVMNEYEKRLNETMKKNESAMQEMLQGLRDSKCARRAQIATPIAQTAAQISVQIFIAALSGGSCTIS